MKRVEPGLREAVKWGNGCWIGSKGPVAYVYSDTGYVQFGFFNGAALKAPKGLLESVKHEQQIDADRLSTHHELLEMLETVRERLGQLENRLRSS